MSFSRSGHDKLPRGASGTSLGVPRVGTSSSSSRHLTSAGAAGGQPRGRGLRGGGEGGGFFADRAHGGRRRILATCQMMQLPSTIANIGPPSPPPILMVGPITSSGETVSANLLPPVLPPEARVAESLQVVSFRNVSYNAESRFSFHVFINYPDASLSSRRSGNCHYVTSYFSMRGPPMLVTINTQVSVRGALRDLGLSERDSFMIQVVPELGTPRHSVNFGQIFREYVTGP